MRSAGYFISEMEFKAQLRNGVSRTDESTVASTGNWNEEIRSLMKYPLVSISIRLVWTIHRHTDVFRLLGRELGQ